MCPSHAWTLSSNSPWLSLLQSKAWALISAVHALVAGPRCSRRCRKPSLPPPPPGILHMRGPVTAHLKPTPVVTVVSEERRFAHVSVDLSTILTNLVAGQSQHPFGPECRLHYRWRPGECLQRIWGTRSWPR